ncbi:MAG TPA: hypothetical protein VD741_08985 [Solirubrobacterales bacterium]|nr:hypothetical protein [Solirubrobacterales bacterium]
MTCGFRRRRHPFLGGGVLILLVLGCVGAGPAGAAMIDNRGWEQVSPVEKNGGQVDPPGTIAGGGVLQAAAAGGAVTYSSKASFGPDAVGAPPASQYVSRRDTNGWTTQNITVPTLSGTYELFDEGAPYQLFSPDLSRALLLNGDHCRGEATGCAVANPPLPGTDAPAGYQNYYLREGGAFEALVGGSDVAGRGLDPASFDLRLAGASPDLGTVVLSTCSPLTEDAVDGCGTGEPNLYRWSESSGALTLVNAAPGAELAAQAGAISAGGSRIYWRDDSGDLYRWEGGSSSQVDLAAGGAGTFEAASADGSVAFYTESGHLWRYAGGSSTDLTPGGGVLGVLGASSSGATVYFQDGGGLRRWSGGSTTTVAPGVAAADPSTYPPATGRARVSADGTKLLFVSTESLTGYDNLDKYTGLPDSQVFLYDGAAGKLTCVSCHPQGKRPIGPSTIPGAVANGTAPGSVASYKPRALSANGRRVFFDSADALVITDGNSKPGTGAGIPDVYEWEAQGEGTCVASGGCVGIVSSGPSSEGATFADASADGTDVYFLTEASLVGADRGAIDLYDARVDGGFPTPPTSIPCEGDACQLLPTAPLDPSLATLREGLGNPAVTYRKYCRKGYVKRKGLCVKKGGQSCRKGFVKRKGRCVEKAGKKRQPRQGGERGGRR